MTEQPSVARGSLDVLRYIRLIAIAALIAVLVTLVIAGLFHAIRLLSLAAGMELERYEDAPIWLRSTLPLVGFLLLMTYVRVFRVDGRDVGGTHTLNRMANFNGDFPWRNAAMQFVSAATALAAGFSGGRDGPGLHLGAWVASTFRPRFRLTRAEADLLIRTGMTAAIAAGFHTTFAAVLFVAGIIKTEPMSARSFMPLTIAAALGSVLSTWLGVDQLAVGTRIYSTLGAIEWLFVIAMAVPILLVGIATMRLVIDFTRVRGPLYARIMVMALLTAGLAAVFPDVLGLGYDTLTALEQNELEVGVLYLTAFVTIKLLLTSASVAFGVPLGVIGPTIVNGGVLGALCYTAFSIVFPDLIVAPVSLYVLLGAAALLGTVFNVPFAAIVFFLEITMNLWLTLQVALTILLAHECKIKLWGTQSIFEARLAAQGINVRARADLI